MTTERAPTPFTAATYNIHRAIGSDGRKDPGRIAAALRELACDIVGLQEVESHGPRGTDTHQLDYLASEGGYEAIAGPTMEQPEGDYGNALLTKAPVLDVTRHAFDVSRWEPRGAIEACVEIRGRRVRVVVTHLGLHLSERRSQIARIMDVVGEDPEAPTILLGDFNEWLPWAESRRRLRERFGRFPTPATFPSRWPWFALDHVCVRPERALVVLEPVRTPLTRMASDHLPLRATVALD